MGRELPVEVQTFKPELNAYLRSAQSIVHLAHADRGTSIKPVRPPENPDTRFSFAAEEPSASLSEYIL